MAQWQAPDPVANVGGNGTPAQWQAPDPAITYQPQNPSLPVAHSVRETMLAAYENSTLGLMFRGKLPDIQENPNPNMLESLAGDTIDIASNAGVGAIGLAVGGGLGAATGGPAGALAGAGMGAFALPMGLRTYLMKTYQLPAGPRTWGQILDVAKNTLVSSAKGAAFGFLTAETAGTMTPEAMAGLGIEGAGRQIAAANATKFVTAATMSGALNGHYIPSWGDVENGALMMLGKAPKSQLDLASERLANAYAQTGIPPETLATRAAQDPALKDALMSSSDMPPQLRQFSYNSAVNAAVPDVSPALEIAAKEKYDDLPPSMSNFTPPVPIDTAAITDEATLKGATQRLAAAFDAKMQEQTGKVSLTDTDEAAVNVLGADSVNRIMNEPREAGAPTNAAVVRATGSMAVAGMHEVQDMSEPLIDKFDAKEPVTIQEQAEYVSKLLKPMAVLADAAGDAGEAGRALNAAKAVSGLRVKAEYAESAIKQFEQDGDFEKLVRTMHDLPGIEDKLAAVRPGFFKTITDRPFDLWRAGVLGIKSFIAKGAGDTYQLASTSVNKSLSTVYGALDPTQFGKNDKEFFRDAVAWHAGVLRGVPSAFKIMYKTFKDPSGETTGFEPRENNLWQTEYAPEWLANQFSIFPSRIMGGITSFYKTLQEEGARYERATHITLTRGIQPGTVDYDRNILQLVQRPTPGMLETMEDAGQKGTFTSPLTGKSGEILSTVNNNAYTRWLFPFKTVPVNLQKEFFRHFPLLGNLMKSQLDDLRAGGARMHTALARQTIGIAAAMYAIHAYNEGTFTGGNLFSTPGQKNVAADEQKPLYAMQHDGKWYGFGRLPVIGPLFSTIADLVDAHQHAETPLSTQTFAALVPAIAAHVMASQAYFTGLHLFFHVADEPASIQRVLSDQLGSFVPGMLRQTASQLDPAQRQVNNLMDEFREGFPFIRETLLPRLNEMTGEPRINPENISPFDVEPVGHDKLAAEFERLHMGIAGAPTKMQNIKDSGKFGETPIPPEDQNLFTSAAGKELHQIGEDFVNNPDYDKLPEPTKMEVLKRFVGIARKVGRASLPPDERAALKEQALQHFGEALQQK